LHPYKNTSPHFHVPISMVQPTGNSVESFSRIVMWFERYPKYKYYNN